MNSVNNKYRYRISSRLGLQQVNPLGEADFTIEWSQEEDEGKLDYKQELPSNIVFRGTPYETMLKLERSIYRCDFIQIAVDRPCDSGPGDTWVEWFNGRMSLNDGEWDLDKCEVKIKLDDLKEEQCFEDNKTTEINLLQNIFSRRTVFLNPTNVTIETVEYSETVDLSTGDCGALAWGGAGSPSDGNWNYYYYRFTQDNSLIPAQCEMVTRWARETVLVDCGDPAPGPEWLLITDGCPGGQRKYARPARTYACQYQYPNYGDAVQITEYECQIVGSSTAVPSIDNGVTLNDVVALFINTFCPGFTFVSDFFQINPDVPSAVNYVTGQRSKTRFLTLFQKSDVKRPTASGNATKANLSFEKLFEMLVKAYNVRWRVEGSTVRMEHVSYWTRNAGLDLTQPKYAQYIRGLRKYSYQSDDIPAREEFKWMEAGYGDFQGVPIIYSGGCVTKGSRNNVKQFAIDKFTTDVELVLSNPNPDSNVVSDDGFVLIAADYDGTNYYIITESAIFGGSSLNNSLAWAQLHRDYHKWDRPLSSGSMNSTPTDFFTTKPTKKGEKIRIPLCCTDTFNPDETIKTPLGLGVVDKATFSFRDETLEVELLYPADQDLTTNTRPVANNDTAMTYQGLPVIINVLGNDSDPDVGGVITSVQIMSNPMHGTIEIQPDKTIKYTPTGSYIGDDYFVYRILDDWNEPSNNALVAVTILPPNQGPNAVNDLYIGQVNAVLAVLAPGVFANDTDDISFSLHTFDTTSTQGGTVSMDSGGGFTYNPPPGFVGNDTFTYTIIDGQGLTDTATVTIDVRNPNNPVANDDSYTTPRNTNLTIAAPGLLANDTTTIGTLSTLAQTVPTVMGGSVTIGSAGGFTYTPPTNYTGPDTFIYTASNGTGNDQATVTINVLPVIYVRLQQTSMNHGQLTQMCGDPPFSTDGGDYWQGTFKLFFYSNSAGTIPLNVTGLGLNVNLRITGSPISGPVYTNDYTETNVTGTEYSLFGGGPWTYYYQEYDCNLTTVMYINESISLRPGNYIII
jgi:hypothetical protein